MSSLQKQRDYFVTRHDKQREKHGCEGHSVESREYYRQKYIFVDLEDKVQRIDQDFALNEKMLIQYQC